MLRRPKPAFQSTPPPQVFATSSAASASSAPLMLPRRPRGPAAEPPSGARKQTLPRRSRRTSPAPNRRAYEVSTEPLDREGKAAHRKRQHPDAIRLANPREQTFLEGRRVSKPVHADYTRRFQAFVQWAATLNLALTDRLSIQQALLGWAHAAFFEGLSISDLQKLMAAVIYFRVDLDLSQASFPRLRQASKGWAKLVPAQTRMPIPWIAVTLVCNHLIASSEWEAAATTVLTFMAYLRPSDVLSLRVCDVVPPPPSASHSRHPWSLILHPSEQLFPSKTGLFDEAILLDSPLFPWTADFLTAWTRGRPALERLVRIDYSDWSRAFLKAALAVGLSVLGPPTLYALRHGGASHEALHRVRPLAEIKKRGRWHTDASVARYEKGGRVAQAENRIPPKWQRMGASTSSQFGDILLGSIPPVVARVAGKFC